MIFRGLFQPQLFCDSLKIQPRHPLALSAKAVPASLSRVFSLSFSLYCRDTDDVGNVIRGSMNLKNATAWRVNEKKLHLSNHNLIYYLKSDSKKDMDIFVRRLKELNVVITDR